MAFRTKFELNGIKYKYTVNLLTFGRILIETKALLIKNIRLGSMYLEWKKN